LTKRFASGNRIGKQKQPKSEHDETPHDSEKKVSKRRGRPPAKSQNRDSDSDTSGPTWCRLLKTFKTEQKKNRNAHREVYRTEQMYYVPEACVQSRSPQKLPPKQDDEKVDVPGWRIVTIPTGYQMEGTENLDDEIFLKRHQKPENEEKRRKRWDLQRLREQRLYEKLQQGRSAGKNSNDETADCETTNTLYPDPDKIKFVEVCEKVSVTAFGQAIPSFSAQEFQLSWFDAEKEKSKWSGRGKRR